MEIKLKRNGWHMKLQEFVLNNPPTFNNFCPYFWLTNFCILAFLPVALVKGIGALVMGTIWLFKQLFEAFDKYICEPALNAAARAMGEDDIITSWCINSYYNRGYTEDTKWTQDDWADYEFWSQNYFKKNPTKFDYDKKEAMDKKFQLWKQNNPNWQEKLNKIKEERQLAWKKQQEKREAAEKKALEYAQKNADRIKRAEIRKQKIFVAIIKYTKWLAILVGVAIIALGLYYIGIFAKYCWDHFWWSRFVTVMKWVGIVLGIGLVATGIIFLIVKLVTSAACKSIGLCRLFETKFMRWLGSMIAQGATWLWKTALSPGLEKLCGLFEFFWMYIMAVKKDYCPGISWDEEK